MCGYFENVHYEHSVLSLVVGLLYCGLVFCRLGVSIFRYFRNVMDLVKESNPGVV